MLVCLTGIGAHAFRIEPNPIVDPQNARVILDGLEDIIGEFLTGFIQESLAVLPQNRFESAQEMRETLLQIKNAQYMAMGANLARNEMEKMRKEIERLKKELKTQDEDFQPEKSGVTQVVIDTGIITTQKEVNGFNIIKRVIKNGGLDETRLYLKDTVEFCGINIDNDQKKTLIRLYFNDENNLSFAIVLSNGKEDTYNINTLKGIAPKKEQILDRAKELISGKKPPVKVNNSLLDEAIRQTGYTPKEEVEEKKEDVGGKDYTKYTLNNGVEKYAKNRLILAVVREYIRQNPKTTLTQLKSVFPDNLQGSLGVVQKLSTVAKKERYFTKKEEIILDGNNEKIVVCNQWGIDKTTKKGNFTDFVDHARKLGFVIETVSK